MTQYFRPSPCELPETADQPRPAEAPEVDHSLAVVDGVQGAAQLGSDTCAVVHRQEGGGAGGRSWGTELDSIYQSKNLPS